MSKGKKVKLFAKGIGAIEFSPEHAARIMALPEDKRGGWIEVDIQPQKETKSDADSQGNTGPSAKRSTKKRNQSSD